MKVVPTISAEFAIKLGLAVGAAWVLYALTKKAGQAISTTFDAVGTVLGDVGEAVNPVSNENIVNKTVTAIGNATVGQDGPGRNADGSWTFGGWVYDTLHGDQVGMMTTGKPKF